MRSSTVVVTTTGPGSPVGRGFLSFGGTRLIYPATAHAVCYLCDSAAQDLAGAARASAAAHWHESVRCNAVSTVFYSWQSDREQTRQTIKQALLQAIQTLNAETPHQPLSLDEDTANEPGSPEIASAILDKIAACGIFVADVTPISEPTTSRVTPNPNVLIELGYALGTGLGGARVISVVNRDHLPEGKPEGLPFDLRHRRVVLYSSADVESLPDDLAEALRLVNAARERAGLPPEVTDEALRVLDAVAVRATNGQEYPQHLSPDEVGELRAEVGLPQAHLNQILSRLHQRRRYPISIRVDADHMIHDVCQHDASPLSVSCAAHRKGACCDNTVMSHTTRADRLLIRSAPGRRTGGGGNIGQLVLRTLRSVGR